MKATSLPRGITLRFVGILLALSPPLAAETIRCHIECSGGVPQALVWQSETDQSYDVWFSPDLTGWAHVAGYPQQGTGGQMEYAFSPGARGFFKISSEAWDLAGLAPGRRGFGLVALREFIPGMAQLPGDMGRRIWDLERSKGRIYIGLGDWNLQSGPQPIVSYNPVTGRFSVEKYVTSDSIENYKRIDGHLYALHTDEVGGGFGTFDWQGPGSDSWTTAAPYTDATHAFDCTRRDGRIYLATGGKINNLAAQIRSSADNGQTWTLEYQTYAFNRFKYIGSDETTVFATAEDKATSFAKQKRGWFEVNTQGAKPRPITLNGLMRMCVRGSFLQLRGTSLVSFSTLPYNQPKWPAFHVAEPDSQFPREVLFAVVDLGDGRKEVFATTDFRNWTSVLSQAEQERRGIVSHMRDVWCIAYHNNTLYLGMVDGDLYRIENVFSGL